MLAKAFEPRIWKKPNGGGSRRAGAGAPGGKFRNRHWRAGPGVRSTAAPNKRHPSPIRQKTSVGFYSCRRRVRGGVGRDSALISQERAARVKTTPVRRASDSADRFTKKRSEQGARLFTRNPLASFLVGGGKNKTWIAQHPEAVITHASARVAACVIWHIHTDLHVYTLLSLLISPYTWRVFVFFAQSAGHTLTLMSGRTCSMREAVDFTTP